MADRDLDYTNTCRGPEIEATRVSVKCFIFILFKSLQQPLPPFTIPPAWRELQQVLIVFLLCKFSIYSQKL